MEEKKVLKPNGLELGVFIISIDDGFVEYSYHVKPEESCSISEMHKWICRVLGAKKEDGKIRIDENDKLRTRIAQLEQLLTTPEKGE